MSERVGILQCSRSFALGRPHAIQYAVNNVRRSNSDRSRRGYTLWEERLLGLPSRRAWFLPKSKRLRRPRAARRSAPPTRCRSGGIGWKVVDQVGGYAEQLPPARVGCVAGRRAVLLCTSVYPSAVGPSRAANAGSTRVPGHAAGRESVTVSIVCHARTRHRPSPPSAHPPPPLQQHH